MSGPGVSSEDRARWLVTARAARALAADVHESAQEREGDHAGRRLADLAAATEKLAECVEEMARALP